MNNTNTTELIDKLTKAISFKFAADKTAPGLTVSALKQGKGYYCSVVRYDGAFARDKKVVVKAKADTLDKALTDVATQFLKLAETTKDPIQLLGEAINTDK